jgi:hypothetical protein
MIESCTRLQNEKLGHTKKAMIYERVIENPFIYRVRLIIMCLNKSCIKEHIDENLSNAFPVQNGLKQGEDLPSSFFNFA